jgi:hypothetical protein
MHKIIPIGLIALTTIVAGCSSPSHTPRASSSAAASADTPLRAGSPQPADFTVNKPAPTAAYGFSDSDPIKVGGPDGGPARERRFLDQLAGPNGEKITYTRIGSCCPFPTPRSFLGNGLLDQYEVRIAGDETPKILYLNMYDYEEPLIPRGFTAKKR